MAVLLRVTKFFRPGEEAEAHLVVAGDLQKEMVGEEGPLVAHQMEREAPWMSLQQDEEVEVLHLVEGGLLKEKVGGAVGEVDLQEEMLFDGVVLFIRRLHKQLESHKSTLTSTLRGRPTRRRRRTRASGRTCTTKYKQISANKLTSLMIYYIILFNEDKLL